MGMANSITYSAADSTAGSSTIPYFAISAVAVAATSFSAFVNAALDSEIRGRSEEAYDELNRSLKPERPKYDPYNARAMWTPAVLSAATRPEKRPSKQVLYNQVPRSVRPQRQGRKR